MATFNPFNPDGTWNYKAAQEASYDDVNKAWEEYMNKAGFSGQGFDPWARISSEEPKMKNWASLAEMEAFKHWRRIRKNASGVNSVRGTEEYWYNLWQSEGRHEWEDHGKDPFLWDMDATERDKFFQFRSRSIQEDPYCDEKHLRAHWKAAKESNARQDRDPLGNREYFGGSNRKRWTWEGMFGDQYHFRGQQRQWGPGSDNASLNIRRLLWNRRFEENPLLFQTAIGEDFRKKAPHSREPVPER